MTIRTKPVIFIMFFIALAWSACTPKEAYNNITTAEATFVESTASGLVTVKAIGYGTDFNKAHSDAIHRTFETILLRGLPHFSALRRPLISDTENLDNNYPDFLTDFFSNNMYSQFITAQDETFIIEELKNPKGLRISNTMTINYDGLRRFLEKEGVIRTFGY